MSKSAPVTRSSSLNELYEYYVQQYVKREAMIWKRYRAEMFAGMLSKGSFELQLKRYEESDRAKKLSAAESVMKLVRRATSRVSAGSAQALQKAIEDQINAEIKRVQEINAQKSAEQEREEFREENVLGGYKKVPSIFELQNRKWTWDEIKDNYHALKEYAEQNQKMLQDAGIMEEGESASHYAAQQIHDTYFYYS